MLLLKFLKLLLRFTSSTLVLSNIRKAFILLNIFTVFECEQDRREVMAKGAVAQGAKCLVAHFRI